GVAFSVAVPPRGFAYGLVLGPDLGIAYNVSLPGATLLLKGGGSAVVGIGDGGGGAFPGLHFGAALVARTGARTGLLLDVTEHIYLGVPVLSIGVGLVALPRGGR
ncbi:MAG: hypothetical protein HY560_02600, partial [Gemmatimonadetes bacterium]|nr:hypothetical protein [Gemmatimonadota bacterium]